PHAGRGGRRVRPHAQDQRPRRPRSLESLLLGAPGGRRRSGGADHWGLRPPRRAACPPAGYTRPPPRPHPRAEPGPHHRPDRPWPDAHGKRHRGPVLTDAKTMRSRLFPWFLAAASLVLVAGSGADLDLGPLVRLTSDGLDKQRPSWAPDGRRLLYARHTSD